MEQNESNYNGWTNYETWVAALWLDNSQASQHYWQEVAGECQDAAANMSAAEQKYWSTEEATRSALADRLKREVAEATPETIEASLYADLLAAAFRRVNWWEIADNWLRELNE
jgi:hypothetical protein